MIALSVIEFLYNSNPWWEGKKLGYTFRRPIYYGLLECIHNQDSAGSIVLLGPRRTGKTVILQQIAETLTNEELSVVYIPIDELVELKLGRLIDIVEFYLKNLRETGKTVFLLDEVQYYGGWAREVKILVDRFRRLGEKIVFVCTGSSSLGVTIGAGEALLGRAGIMRIFPMSPLEVIDFRENRGLSEWIWSNRIFVAENALLNPELVLKKIYHDLGSAPLEAVQRELMKILYWGSLIEIVNAINKGTSNIEVRRRLLEIVDLTILRDILRIQKLYGSKYELNPDEATKIIKLSMVLSPLITSINDLSTRLGINKEKIKLAVRLAEYAGLIRTMKQFATSPMTVARKRKIKIHTMDTGLRNALKNISWRAYISNNEEIGKNLENFIISRLYPILHTLGEPNPTVFFWQRKIGGKTYEIDAIISIHRQTLAIETKKSWGKTKSIRKIGNTLKKKIIIRLENPQTLLPLTIL